MRKITKTLNYYITLWKFNAAKREAERMHTITGKRYWVIRLLGKYHVFSTDDVKGLKRKGIFQKGLDNLKLREVAAYHTK